MPSAMKSQHSTAPPWIPVTASLLARVQREAAPEVLALRDPSTTAHRRQECAATISRIVIEELGTRVLVHQLTALCTAVAGIQGTVAAQAFIACYWLASNSKVPNAGNFGAPKAVSLAVEEVVRTVFRCTGYQTTPTPAPQPPLLQHNETTFYPSESGYFDWSSKVPYRGSTKR